MPASLQQVIEHHLERLRPEEQRLLEVASVAGAEFSAAAAAGLETDRDRDREEETAAVEERCEALVRREQFLKARGTAEWPDGTVAARYSFVHALYQNVLYERVTAARRVRLHRRIGEREERQDMGSGRERLPPSWRCTLSGGEMTAGQSTICNKRQRMPCGGMPTQKRSQPCKTLAQCLKL